MKVLINALRIIVGTLFVLTGIVKLNDPIGFALLLQHYFGETGLQQDFIYNRALIFSVLLILMEITFGVILILGYIFRLARWPLVITSAGLTVFTLYMTYINPAEDCGYLTRTALLNAEGSFWKFLCIFIIAVILFIKSSLVESTFRLMVNKWIVFITFITSLFISYQVLTHLPLIDLSPFKKGVSLTKAIESSHPSELSPWDFGIFKGNKVLTPALLDKEKLLLIVSYDLVHTNAEGWEKIKPLIKKAQKKGYYVQAVAPASLEDLIQFKTESKLSIDFAQIDKNQAQNMIRSNPGILILKKGTIQQKKHWHRAHSIDLE